MSAGPRAAEHPPETEPSPVVAGVTSLTLAMALASAPATTAPLVAPAPRAGRAAVPAEGPS